MNIPLRNIFFCIHPYSERESFILYPWIHVWPYTFGLQMSKFQHRGFFCSGRRAVKGSRIRFFFIYIFEFTLLPSEVAANKREDKRADHPPLCVDQELWGRHSPPGGKNWQKKNDSLRVMVLPVNNQKNVTGKVHFDAIMATPLEMQEVLHTQL